MEHLTALGDKEATLREREEELLAAQAEGREKEQCSLEALKEKDTELQLVQSEKQKAEEKLRLNNLEHKIALQEKDLKIKELELNIKHQSSRQNEESMNRNQVKAPIDVTVTEAQECSQKNDNPRVITSASQHLLINNAEVDII